MNNSKFIEAHLTRDANGLWSFDDAGAEWSAADNIEYWLSVENSNLGYYTNSILRVQGNHIVHTQSVMLK